MLDQIIARGENDKGYRNRKLKWERGSDAQKIKMDTADRKGGALSNADH